MFTARTLRKLHSPIMRGRTALGVAASCLLLFAFTAPATAQSTSRPGPTVHFAGPQVPQIGMRTNGGPSKGPSANGGGQFGTPNLSALQGRVQYNAPQQAAHQNSTRYSAPRQAAHRGGTRYGAPRQAAHRGGTRYGAPRQAAQQRGVRYGAPRQVIQHRGHDGIACRDACCVSPAQLEYERGLRAGERSGERRGYRHGYDGVPYCDIPPVRHDVCSPAFAQGLADAYATAYYNAYRRGQIDRVTCVSIRLSW